MSLAFACGCQRHPVCISAPSSCSASGPWVEHQPPSLQLTKQVPGPCDLVVVRIVPIPWNGGGGSVRARGLGAHDESTVPDAPGDESPRATRARRRSRRGLLMGPRSPAPPGAQRRAPGRRTQTAAAPPRRPGPPWRRVAGPRAERVRAPARRAPGRSASSGTRT
jgi:hypothetical protein